jgi:excinuclease ABC subunit B
MKPTGFQIIIEKSCEVRNLDKWHSTIEKSIKFSTCVLFMKHNSVDIGEQFKLKSEFKPAGDQPKAIEELVDGIKRGVNPQTLLGVTGSGKTFTIANVIEQVQKPTLVVVHNKTLAAQLYNEFKAFFPENRVEYFVSFYDYYQPESYVPANDQYIEKDSQINEYIERMRLSATASLMSRRDVIIVASVSCIYGLGNPDNFTGLGFDIVVGQQINRKEFMLQLLNAQYERNDIELLSGRYRVKGDTIDLVPGYDKDIIRVEFFGDEVEKIFLIDKGSGEKLEELSNFFLFPARHFVVPEEKTLETIELIKKELKERLPELDLIESHRLKQRTNYDLELLENFGFCKGIENYSRHFDGRAEGEQPYTLLDYFKNDFLLVMDESHQTIPQFNGMYKGDRQRKQNLIDYGFRLPSALDNRPLKFDEFEKYIKKENVIFVSATPDKYERSHSKKIVEQIIRPTGLVDPGIEIHEIDGQMQHILVEIEKVTKRGERVLVTTLTKKLAEEVSDFFASKKIKSRYLHSEIKTLERTELIRQLREGKFDVLVGINLLREGIDLPEVGLVAIFDADKEGFLRDQKSLIQIIGRAARNSSSKVILYADKETRSMKGAIDETNRRREIQLKFNKEHNITPQTIIKPIEAQKIIMQDTKHIPLAEKRRMVPQLEIEMKNAAEKLDFEMAIMLRDKLALIKQDLSKQK